jgi:hypothetical protein
MKMTPKMALEIYLEWLKSEAPEPTVTTPPADPVAVREFTADDIKEVVGG